MNEENRRERWDGNGEGRKIGESIRKWEKMKAMREKKEGMKEEGNRKIREVEGEKKGAMRGEERHEKSEGDE